MQTFVFAADVFELGEKFDVVAVFDQNVEFFAAMIFWWGDFFWLGFFIFGLADIFGGASAAWFGGWGGLWLWKFGASGFVILEGFV